MTWNGVESFPTAEIGEFSLVKYEDRCGEAVSSRRMTTPE